jgi:GNAT superfamily N-acetyltransferase
MTSTSPTALLAVGSAYAIRRAGPGDLAAVSGLLAQSGTWMNDRGYDAWPADGFPDHRLTPGLVEGTVWLVYDGARPVGTLALDAHPDPEFTAPEADAVGVPALLSDALVLHRLAVDRDRAGEGIGPWMLGWACDHAARTGRKWVVLNCARNAVRLQQFYARHGFRFLVTVTSTGRKSGSLWYALARPRSSTHPRAGAIPA